MQCNATFLPAEDKSRPPLIVCLAVYLSVRPHALAYNSGNCLFQSITYSLPSKSCCSLPAPFPSKLALWLHLFASATYSLPHPHPALIRLLSLCVFISRHYRTLPPPLASHLANPVGQLHETGALTLDTKCLAACVGGWPALVLCHLNFICPFSTFAASTVYRFVVVACIGFWMADRQTTTFNNHIACHLKVVSYTEYTFLHCYYYCCCCCCCLSFVLPCWLAVRLLDVSANWLVDCFTGYCYFVRYSCCLSCFRVVACRTFVIFKTCRVNITKNWKPNITLKKCKIKNNNQLTKAVG